MTAETTAGREPRQAFGSKQAGRAATGVQVQVVRGGSWCQESAHRWRGLRHRQAGLDKSAEKATGNNKERCARLLGMRLIVGPLPNRSWAQRTRYLM